MKDKVKNVLIKCAPIIGLVVLFVIFIILGFQTDINFEYTFKNIFNQSVVVILAATGAIFIYSIGSFDISLGASLCVSAIIGAIVYNKTNSVFVMALTCVGVAVIISLLNSTLASVFNLPVFVTTIAMLSLLNAFVLILIGFNGTGDFVKVPASAVASLNTVRFKLLIMILYMIISVFVFNFLKQGRAEKFLGGNPTCSKLSGVNNKVVSIIAFVMAGFGVGLAAFLTIIYAPTLSRTTASSVGMDVIIAIVFGGMPVSGGARSKIYAAIIGCFSMTLLSQIMLMLNLGSGIGQIVKAVIFLVVVFISITNNRKLLAR